MPPKKKVATFTTNWQSHKATDAAIAKFEEAFAAEMGTKPIRTDQYERVDNIPSGSLAFDAATGIGGWPVGRVCEIWGPEHAGKTTECMMAVKEAQEKFPDKMCAWVDIEQTFDEAWAETLGVDLKRLWLMPNPQNAEEAADAAKRFVMSGLCSLVILDSVGGMIGQVEFEKEAEDATVGIVAKIITRMVKQIAPMAKANGTTIIVVNQVRAIIGAMKGPTTGTGGGWALKHVTSLRISCRRGETKSAKVDGEDVPIGHEVINKVEKNKMAPYGRVAKFVLYNTPTKTNDVGVDPLTEAVEFGKKYGIIEGSTWLTLPNGERFNGKDKTIAYLEEHPEVVKDIRDKVLAHFAGPIDGDVEGEPDEDESVRQMQQFLAGKDDAPFGAEEKSA